MSHLTIDTTYDKKLRANIYEAYEEGEKIPLFKVIHYSNGEVGIIGFKPGLFYRDAINPGDYLDLLTPEQREKVKKEGRAWKIEDMK